MLAARQADGAKKGTECRYKEQQQLKSAVHRWRSGEGDSEETLPQGSSIGFSLGLISDRRDRAGVGATR